MISVNSQLCNLQRFLTLINNIEYHIITIQDWKLHIIPLVETVATLTIKIYYLPTCDQDSHIGFSYGSFS